MAKKTLGVGIIGGGFVGQFHIRSWEGVRDADINGVVAKTVDEAKAASALVKRLGLGTGKIFKSVTDMVADPSIDALWMCAPNFTRIELMEEIIHAVESGKGELIGVACEKPLGRNVREAGCLCGAPRAARYREYEGLRHQPLCNGSRSTRGRTSPAT